ncbi:uncharacterized protein BT62DRAFT_700299 [Guyanagaster necrorhizus]|uniref:F-box domain-containing protein n=1 Tax=Guyanagaster necrorhizus TaxID=856835 RepID=A0A9P8AM63_9AGAR|nr:uncharacterized protein BT62DRAFT_700299 [Guyanagaster necrorhizus MCA 3950]KAG7439537.1 hypothetical protein BT62DRAFT_700299 [Guyanagaster necrorhizus MCA 3950]
MLASKSLYTPANEFEHEHLITLLLRKKRPLLDADTARIEEDISTLELEISSLERQMIMLMRKKDQLEHSLSRRKALLSPIRRLPSDVLLEIFSWAVHRPKNSLDVTTGVWPLGQVCGCWRDIVSTLPVLWSVVILQPPYTHHSVDILSHHFRRSAQFPLWIAIRTEGHVIDRRIFDMVLQKSALWKMVDMCARSKDLEKLASVSGNIPLLEELYVSTADTADFSTDALSSAPSLRRVNVESLEISQMPLNASLSILTHFSGTLHHLADIRYITQVQTLVEISILFFDDWDGPLDSSNLLPVRMEQLQSLTVNDMGMTLTFIRFKNF